MKRSANDKANELRRLKYHKNKQNSSTITAPSAIAQLPSSNSNGTSDNNPTVDPALPRTNSNENSDQNHDRAINNLTVNVSSITSSNVIFNNGNQNNTSQISYNGEFPSSAEVTGAQDAFRHNNIYETNRGNQDNQNYSDTSVIAGSNSSNHSNNHIAENTSSTVSSSSSPNSNSSNQTTTASSDIDHHSLFESASLFGRKNKTITDKLQIIDIIKKSKLSIRNFLKQNPTLEVSRSTLSSWLKSEESFKKALAENPVEASKATKVKPLRYPNTIKALERWCQVWCDQGGFLNSFQVKTQYLFFLNHYPDELQKFNEEELGEVKDSTVKMLRERLRLRTCTRHGEASSAPNETVVEFRQRFNEIVDGYDEHNVFNYDETSFYYCMLRNKGLTNRPDIKTGFKQDKRRISVGVLANASGDFIELDFLSKVKSPRCFHPYTPSSAGYSYYANSKGWMTREIFTSIIRKLDIRMKRENRKILFLLDNFSAHKLKVKNIEDAQLFIKNENPENFVVKLESAATHEGVVNGEDGEGSSTGGDNISNNLILSEVYIPSNIMMYYLPPNTTSHLQPLDQGIISALKFEYHKLHLKSSIERFQDDENLNVETCFKVDLKEALQNFTKASKSLKRSTIRNCFVKAGITKFRDLDNNSSGNSDNTTVMVATNAIRVDIESETRELEHLRQQLNDNNIIRNQLLQSDGYSYLANEDELIQNQNSNQTRPQQNCMAIQFLINDDSSYSRELTVEGARRRNPDDIVNELQEENDSRQQIELITEVDYIQQFNYSGVTYNRYQKALQDVLEFQDIYKYKAITKPDCYKDTMSYTENLKSIDDFDHWSRNTAITSDENWKQFNGFVKLFANYHKPRPKQSSVVDLLSGRQNPDRIVNVVNISEWCVFFSTLPQNWTKWRNWTLF